MTAPAAVPRRLAIAGLGLIGGSIALRARIAWPGLSIVGLDLPACAADALRRGIVDEVARDVSALTRADLVVLSVPMELMHDYIGRLGALATTTTITDVGSTKRRVMVSAADAALPAFVGGHPMAGSERAGLEAARPDLFDGRPWLLVQGAGGARVHQQVEAFAAGLGGVPRWMEAAGHDRAMAYLSHLPQLLATTLMNVATRALGEGGLDAAGPAFAEMTRLASSQPDVWQGILEHNADFMTEALARFSGELPSHTELQDPRWVERVFTEAGEARARFRRHDPRRG
jgi:prephenate dehydrogenase